MAAFLRPPITTDRITIIAKARTIALSLIKIARAHLALWGTCHDHIGFYMAGCFALCAGYILELEVAAKVMVLIIIVVIVSDGYGNDSR